MFTLYFLINVKSDSEFFSVKIHIKILDVLSEKKLYVYITINITIWNFCCSFLCLCNANYFNLF